MQVHKTKRAVLMPMLALLALPFIGCQGDEVAVSPVEEEQTKVEPYFIYELGKDQKKVLTTIEEPSLYKSIAESIKLKNVHGAIERFYATYDSVTGKLNGAYINQVPVSAMPKASSYLASSDYRLYGVTDGVPQWGINVADGAQAGTTGQSRPTYAFHLQISSAYAAGSGTCCVRPIKYKTHHAQWGWLPAVSNAEVSGCSQANVGCHIENGTPTSALKYIQAIQIMEAYPGSISGVVHYRAHVGGIGWQEWRLSSDAAAYAGTVGQSRTLQAIEVKYLSD